jgi:hypothetical protein
LAHSPRAATRVRMARGGADDGVAGLSVPIATG